ncbi:MAG TPA: ABC transporter permease [Gemmatimonadaceae bacterium]|nr:ABC transporter permease [Gemmatimonadaceae bacterium]
MRPDLTRAYFTSARPGATGWVLQSLIVVLLLGAGGLAALVARRGDHKLVRVLATDDSGAAVAGASYPLYLDYRAKVTAFAGLAAYFDSVAVVMEYGAGSEEMTGALVSGNFFDVLGARALLGRPIRVEDELADASPVVVLSHRAWQRNLLGDTAVIGRALIINGGPFTVVGVMPPDFRDVSDGVGPELWAPIAAVAKLSPAAASLQPLRRRGLWWLSMVGRLAPTATIEDARAQLEAISAARSQTRSLDPIPRVVPFEPRESPAVIRTAAVPAA